MIFEMVIVTFNIKSWGVISINTLVIYSSFKVIGFPKFFGDHVPRTLYTIRIYLEFLRIQIKYSVIAFLWWKTLSQSEYTKIRNHRKTPKMGEMH